MLPYFSRSSFCFFAIEGKREKRRLYDDGEDDDGDPEVFKDIERAPEYEAKQPSDAGKNLHNFTSS